MALPLIPIISALTSIAPSIAGWIGGDKAEDAAQAVTDIARKVTGQNEPEKAVDMILQDETLKLQFMMQLDRSKNELDKLYLADKQNAREMYGKHNEQADKIANRVTWLNVPYICLMVAVNCAIVYFLKENVELVAIASNIIGMVIKSLLDQIQSVISFYFGSSLGSKSK